jgi:Ca-activated chloride channel family protein
MVNILPEILAMTVALFAVVAEWVHARRIRRLKRLAFGPSQRPARWTWSVPGLRVLAMAIATWGFASLLWAVEARVHNTDEIASNELKHLVLVVDVSPSMGLVDAGADGKQTRRQRASDIVESLFNRIPLRQFRITFIAVYTDAKPLLEDSSDHEVVRHMMEKMPMWHAFKPGKTQLLDGIELAAKIARPWNPGSAVVLLLTDGDSVPPAGMPRMPAAVADFVVVGVGDSSRGKFLDGHQSRQDVNTLRQVANRLHGYYHNGNQKHLTSQVVAKLAEAKNRKSFDQWTRREWALAATLLGTTLLAVIPVLLHYFGTSYVAGTGYQKSVLPARIE